MDNELFFIVNPNSGSNKGRIWDEISAYLTENNIKFSCYLTKSAGDAIVNIPKILAEGHRNLIVLGGDGMVCKMRGLEAEHRVPRGVKDIVLGEQRHMRLRPGDAHERGRRGTGVGENVVAQRV